MIFDSLKNSALYYPVSRFVLKQHNNRLAMTVRNVKDIEDGYKTLQQL